MEGKEFILALCLKGESFKLQEKDVTDLSTAIDGAKYWNSITEGGDSLVVHKDTMEIQWPDRLKGKKIAQW